MTDALRPLSDAELGPEHPNVASVLSNIATVCHKTGRSGEGVAASERAIVILRRALGSRHPTVLHAKAAAVELWGPRAEEKARPVSCCIRTRVLLLDRSAARRSPPANQAASLIKFFACLATDPAGGDRRKDAGIRSCHLLCG